ncbi:MAG: hypothetical protein J1E80_09660 [Desulfovibrionaceae bacterium]|nr:hypothetical protein [Desulfovibrionaceae bacterium]
MSEDTGVGIADGTQAEERAGAGPGDAGTGGAGGESGGIADEGKAGDGGAKGDGAGAEAGGIADEPAKADGIADGADGDKAGEKKADGEKAKAPEAYDLKAPDGFPIPEDNLASFSKACREAGLSREQAEKILDWHRERFTEGQGLAAQEEARVLDGWRTEILADADFGGSNYKATVADARRALAAFDPDGKLRAFLRESRWQFNPDVIRVAARVGRALGEHGFVGQGGAGRQEKPLEERMYPNMKF